MPRATKATTVVAKPLPAPKLRKDRAVETLPADVRYDGQVMYNDTVEVVERVAALVSLAKRRNKSTVLRRIMRAGLPIVEAEIAKEDRADGAARR